MALPKGVQQFNDRYLQNQEVPLTGGTESNELNYKNGLPNGGGSEKAEGYPSDGRFGGDVQRTDGMSPLAGGAPSTRDAESLTTPSGSPEMYPKANDDGGVENYDDAILGHKTRVPTGKAGVYTANASRYKGGKDSIKGGKD